ncbi:hypothetical protein BDK51DRAFT_29157 [Blyttiomyces helicus]|uniref:Uncharacterized protein n=1 Tax=Blyttiomyces helicus TaxID=388810 RepID=A0A4P9WMT5_9FUNG|nr:hypothetical protein BDK51DRAFT_29157 [Blyttiomyces helicus]|eukprot:RKO94379.1 hypothetical protein BDK51DRAFT_29157 [Blyttiomyces helicus]
MATGRPSVLDGGVLERWWDGLLLEVGSGLLGFTGFVLWRWVLGGGCWGGCLVLAWWAGWAGVLLGGALGGGHTEEGCDSSAGVLLVRVQALRWVFRTGGGEDAGLVQRQGGSGGGVPDNGNCLSGVVAWGEWLLVASIGVFASSVRGGVSVGRRVGCFLCGFEAAVLRYQHGFNCSSEGGGCTAVAALLGGWARWCWRFLWITKSVAEHHDEGEQRDQGPTTHQTAGEGGGDGMGGGANGTARWVVLCGGLWVILLGDGGRGGGLLGTGLGGSVYWDDGGVGWWGLLETSHVSHRLWWRSGKTLTWAGLGNELEEACLAGIIWTLGKGGMGTEGSEPVSDGLCAKDLGSEAPRNCPSGCVWPHLDGGEGASAWWGAGFHAGIGGNGPGSCRLSGVGAGWVFTCRRSWLQACAAGVLFVWVVLRSLLLLLQRWVGVLVVIAVHVAGVLDVPSLEVATTLRGAGVGWIG